MVSKTTETPAASIVRPDLKTDLNTTGVVISNDTVHEWMEFQKQAHKEEMALLHKLLDMSAQAMTIFVAAAQSKIQAEEARDSERHAARQAQEKAEFEARQKRTEVDLAASQARMQREEEEHRARMKREEQIHSARMAQGKF